MSFKLFCDDCYQAGIPRSECGFSLVLDRNGKGRYQLQTKYHKRHPTDLPVKTTIPEWLVNNAMSVLNKLNNLDGKEVTYENDLDYSEVNMESQRILEETLRTRADALGDETKLREIDDSIKETLRALAQHKTNVAGLLTHEVDVLVGHDYLCFYAGRGLRYVYFLKLPERATEKNCKDLVLVDQSRGRKYSFENGERISELMDIDFDAPVKRRPKYRSVWLDVSWIGNPSFYRKKKRKKFKTVKIIANGILYFEKYKFKNWLLKYRTHVENPTETD